MMISDPRIYFLEPLPSNPDLEDIALQLEQPTVSPRWLTEHGSSPQVLKSEPNMSWTKNREIYGIQTFQALQKYIPLG